MKYFFILFLCSFGFAQEKYPKDYFGSPLKIGLSIAGSFGELRPNHFHSGIDFRTQQKEGFPVYATADGFISRINVSLTGYGKCLYLDHPNGFTTVYAHLQKFAPFLEDFTKKKQYEDKTYTLELRPTPLFLMVKKGDLIGYTGNTGGSGGPHLHFEIRNTLTEHVINPFYFGYDKWVLDTKKPIISSLLVYPSLEDGKVNDSKNSIYVPLTLQEDGTYISQKIEARGTIGFAINTHDVSDYNYGKNGIYKLETFLNGSPHYMYEFESFSFDESKHINCFIDYTKYKKTHQRFQKLFVGPVFAENIIKFHENKGLINVPPNLNSVYKIDVYDFHGNKNTIFIPLVYSNKVSNNEDVPTKIPYYLKAEKEHIYSKEGVTVTVPEYAFYDDLFLNFDVNKNLLTFHDATVALNKPISISFNVSAIAATEQEKMFIGNLDGTTIEYNNTIKKDTLFTIKTKKLGKFLLAKDTIAPQIIKTNFKKGDDLTSKEVMQVYATDDLSGIKTYQGYLNGQWILMEYESKLNQFTHYFSDAIFVDGLNEFKFIVTDNLGNSTIFESNFYKKKS